MWLVFAGISAVIFGIRGVLYQWSSQQAMNRSLMLCGVFATGAVLCSVLAVATGSRLGSAELIGIAMGLFSFIANASMYRGYAVGKASLIAVLTGLPPVVVIWLAYFLWQETLSAMQMIAFIIVVVGIIMIRYSADLSLKQLRGIGWGLLCILFFGFNDLSSKQATRLDADMYPTLFFMFATGAICFALSYGYEWLTRQKPIYPATEPAVPLTSSSWSNAKSFVWGLLVGLTNVFGMIFLYQAFAIGVTGLVSAVISLNVLFVVFYSRIVLKDTFTTLEVAGISCAIIGIILLRVFG